MTTKYKYYVGDFETTVFEGQDSTEVWASACVELYTEDVHIFHSIDETFNFLVSLNTNVCIYYHNLKFDGSFWLNYLLVVKSYKQALRQLSSNQNDVEFLPDNEMKNNTFKYSISDMGDWYSITIRVGGHFIVIRDSLKLLPFSVKRIGESFGTKHKKLDMEYKGFRYAGCEITDKEKQYIANDVFVVKEALEIMFTEGHNKLTIGACCLSEYHHLMHYDYDSMFPNLYEMEIDEKKYGSPNAGEYIHRSYKGGWCYLVRGKELKDHYNGITADVNSLYPSVMHSESGSRYPTGKPTFWSGNFIPPPALEPDSYYFIRIITRFYIKPNHLPCIQLKHNLMYPQTEWLDSSDIYDVSTKTYKPSYIDFEGVEQQAFVTLTLTMTDYNLIKDQYYLVDCTILDGCYFHAEVGIFDLYIDKYKKIKLESKGAKRELAKLFLNNLYGKMASSPNSSFKLAYIKEGNIVGFTQVQEFKKKPGYIAVGSAITSYARNFTIRVAQQNYYGVDKAGFIYADTDSIHCDLPADQLKGIKVDSKNFCCWKLESSWDYAKFVRQKTYVEHVVAENLIAIDNPYYNIRCAGMPDRCKQLFLYSMQGLTQEDWQEQYPDLWYSFSNAEKKFVLEHHTLKDFQVGLVVPGKLLPRTIAGGVLLKETTYEMR